MLPNQGDRVALVRQVQSAMDFGDLAPLSLLSRRLINSKKNLLGLRTISTALVAF